MGIITKQKTYFWLIAILAVFNLVILFLLWNGRPEHMPPPGIKETRPGRGFAPAELNLSSEQKEKFDKQGVEYYNSRDSLIQLININKKEMFEEVFKENPDKAKAEKLAEEIGVLNSAMEKAFYKHFTNLKSILTNEQLRTFQNIIEETVDPRFRGKLQSHPF